MSKYPLLKERLLAEGILAVDDIIQPEPIDAPTLALVHTPEYLAKLASSGLSVAEQRRLGLPWSEALWQRSRLASAGTLLAARAALEDGLAGNLAGGTHHAFADHGEGFCVLNDVAIAIRKLQAGRLIERAAIIDLDVHQGNGTAAIFEADQAVFTFSMHGARNYPLAKMRSNLDVALRDGVGDDEYLDVLRQHLPRVLDAANADIVFYLAGVDVAAGDRYGKLALTEEGIGQRDRCVIEAVRSRGVPLTLVLAGGYASSRARTAKLHAHAFREAAAYLRRRNNVPSWNLKHFNRLGETISRRSGNREWLRAARRNGVGVAATSAFVSPYPGTPNNNPDILPARSSRWSNPGTRTLRSIDWAPKGPMMAGGLNTLRLRRQPRHR